MQAAELDTANQAGVIDRAKPDQVEEPSWPAWLAAVPPTPPDINHVVVKCSWQHGKPSWKFGTIIHYVADGDDHFMTYDCWTPDRFKVQFDNEQQWFRVDTLVRAGLVVLPRTIVVNKAPTRVYVHKGKLTAGTKYLSLLAFNNGWTWQ
jgi:hypothetical protein